MLDNSSNCNCNRTIDSDSSDEKRSKIENPEPISSSSSILSCIICFEPYSKVIT